MTCIYDTVHQVGVHIRQAVLDTHGDSSDISIGKRNYYFKISPLDGAQIEQRPISFYVVQFWYS